jgi:hypothetical protein
LKQAFTALLGLHASLPDIASTDNAGLAMETVPDIAELVAARVTRTKLDDVDPLEARLVRHP